MGLANHADPSIRAMVGATLAALGERSGLDALAAVLGETSLLAGSNPPQSIAGFAAFNLANVVDASAAPASASPGGDEPAQAAGWRDWLAAHSAQLAFDQQTHQWRLP
jgi:hypothetical protein